MSTKNTVPPKRPRPILPIVWSIAATVYTGLAVAYIAAFAAGVRPVYYAIIWGVCALVWWGFTVPTAIRAHRNRLESWQRRVELHERLREIDERRERRLSLFLADDGIGDAP